MIVNTVSVMNKYSLSKKKNSGYTLVEVLVGLSIIGMLFGLGFVSFRDFSRRQEISGFAKSMMGDLRLAQGMALAGQKPSTGTCNTLDDYSFKIISSSQYQISADCDGTPVVSKTVTLPIDLTVAFPSVNPIKFKVLGSGTNIPDGTSVPIVFSQLGTSNKFTITVGSIGEIY